MIFSNRTDVGAKANPARHCRTISFLLCALALFWSASARAQATTQCLARESQVLDSPNPTSVVWGFTDDVLNPSVVWGNDSVEEDSLAWGTSAVWGVDGSESADSIREDSVVWGIVQDDLVCNDRSEDDN